MSKQSLATVTLGISISLFAGYAYAQAEPVVPAAPAPAIDTTKPALPVLPPVAPALPAAPAVPAAQQASPPPVVPTPDVDKGPDTLFGGRKVAIGGFGGASPMYTRLVHTNTMLMCGEGALLIDHAFSVGIGGCGVVSEVDLSGRTKVADDRLNMGWGGLKVRYHFMPQSVVNVAIGATMGGGGLQISKWDHDMEAEQGYRMRATFFVFEPEVGVFVNFTRWARMGVVGGYRIVGGVEDSRYLNNSELSGINAGTSFQFGWF